MADFKNINLLASVQKKMFPQGVAVDIMQRLDQLQVFQGNATPSGADLFSSNSYEFQSKALNIFNQASLSGESVLELVKDYNGLEVQSKEVDTVYSSGVDGDKKISIYTFTDANGNTVEINDANAKEFIKQEELAFDGILQGVLDEILSGQISLPEDDSGTTGYEDVAA